MSFRPNRIGYNFNRGGLTNQKLALLGLFMEAQASRRPVILPNFMSLDILGCNDDLHKFGEIYDLSAIQDFAARHDIEILPPDSAEPTESPKESWNYFRKGASRVGQVATSDGIGNANAGFTFDFFKSLLPLLRHGDTFNHLKKTVYETQNIKIAAQFRIELDWQYHCHNVLAKTIKEPEDYLLSFDRIAGKIAATLPDAKKLLVFCDERALPLPKSEIYDKCFDEFGLELYWKSDFLTDAEFGALSNLERTIVDFELAVASHHYVGLTRSSFSNLVTFEKHAATRAPVTTDFIYNKLGDRLGQRTDNGGVINPRMATAPRTNAARRSGQHRVQVHIDA